MGYCSATDYVDHAIAMADAAVETVIRLAGGLVLTDDQWAEVDQAMRANLAAIVAKAKDDDWDCESESRYFGRFRDVIDPDGQFAYMDVDEDTGRGC